MALREDGFHVRKNVIVMQQTITAAPAREPQASSGRYVRLTVPRHSMAERKIRDNFGYVTDAQYLTRQRAVFYLRCFYPSPADDAMNIDFYASVLCRHGWATDVEFKVEKGLPL